MTNARFIFLLTVLANIPNYGLAVIHTDSIPGTEKIQLQSKVDGKAIHLRWAPVDYQFWREGLSKGYVLNRYVIARDGLLLSQPEFKTLTEFPIRVLEENQWEPLVKDNKFSAIAAQAIFGEDFKIDLGRADVISIADKISENNQRFYLALYCADISIAVAKAQGLYFIDTLINENEKYLYKVLIPHETDTIQGFQYVEASDSVYLETPSGLEVSCQNSLANLRWNRPVMTSYSGYVVERSFDKVSFTSISDTPVLTVSPSNEFSTRFEYVVDSIRTPGETFYRVRGRSIFGDLSRPSEIRGCVNQRSESIYVTIGDAMSIDNRSVQLSWDCVGDSVKNFIVERALTDKGPYRLLSGGLPKNQRTYIDQHPDHVNYYRVSAINSSGTVFRSEAFFLPLIDSVPPLPPLHLKGAIDNYGNVKVSWTLNSEPDLFGYRVYIANNRLEEMTQITSRPVIDSSFAFLVNPRLLNDSLYVAVISVDNNQNESPLSALCPVAFPDLIPPSAPTMLPARIDSLGRVVVSFIRSSSKDVVSYEVYRQVSAASHWTRVTNLKPTTSDTCVILDSNIREEVLVFYTAISIDKAGLESLQAYPIQIKNISLKLKPPVEWANASRLDAEKVRIVWRYNEAGVRGFKVYKKIGGSISQIFKTADSTTREIYDSVSEGQKCEYQILALFDNGKTSSLSEVLLAP